MASTIKLKNGSGAPLASDLVQGEPAFDLTNKRLYTEDSGGNVIEVGTNPSSLTTSSADINGGTIDGTVIGGSSAAAGTFTSITGTSANINGTVTADGLTVDGEVDVNSGDISLSAGKALKYSATSYITPENNVSGAEISTAGSFNVKTGSTPLNRFKIDGSTGDLSLFEDTGTTAKFFWDASAEHLKILGGSSWADNQTGLQLSWSDPDGYVTSYYDNTSMTIGAGVSQKTRLTIHGQTSAIGSAVTAHTGGSERLRIDSSGNVGIGTSSPSAKLHVAGSKVIFQAAGPSQGEVQFGTTDTTHYIQAGNDYLGMNIGSVGTGNDGIKFITGTSGSGTERMRIDSSGNVGIGTTSPTSKLTIGTGTFAAAGASTSAMYTDASVGLVQLADGYTWNTRGGSERMRIDSSGNLLVGTTDTNPAGSNVNGVAIRPSGFASSFTGEGGQAINLNRKANDGDIARFFKDGTAVGAIGNTGGGIYVRGQTTGIYFGTNDVVPSLSSGNLSDNAKSLGAASYRWSVVYAATGSINTSDRNEKTDIVDIDAAELRVAQACKGLMKRFKFKDSVEAKGDDARYHFGIIAQDLQAAFEAEGLDASKYAVFCSDTWTDEETGEERTRLGVRYEELLAFIIAAI